MSSEQLLDEYRKRHGAILVPLAQRLQAFVQEAVGDLPRVDRVSARAKDPDRFVRKAEKRLESGAAKYEHPFEQIQDLVGARVVVFYKQDVEAVTAVVHKYFRHIESKDLVPDSVSEFGYVGRHFILAIPSDVVDDDADLTATPDFFELQIKTLFQHAWSEANHDLAYKPGEPPTLLQRRQIAFTAAQAWGADQIFEQLHAELGGAVSSS